MSHQECIGTLGEKEIYKGLGIEKAAMLRMKKGKEIQRKEYNCPKKNVLEHLEKKKSTNTLGILQVDTIKQM